MQGDNQTQPDPQPVEITGLETCTTGPEGHPRRTHCQRCGKPIRGRKRNGYCGNACRMKDRRARQATRLKDLISTIDQALSALREELRGGL